jgi:hypothetical protein
MPEDQFIDNVSEGVHKHFGLERDDTKLSTINENGVQKSFTDTLMNLISVKAILPLIGGDAQSNSSQQLEKVDEFLNSKKSNDGSILVTPDSTSESNSTKKPLFRFEKEAFGELLLY